MLNKNFRELIESLEKSGVRYLVVGGYAVGLHAQEVLEIPFIGFDQLLQNKAASPRGKDKIDLDELLKLKCGDS